MQFSSNKEYIYIGFMHIDGEKEFHYQVKKLICGYSDIKQIKEYIEEMILIKRNITKTPFLTDEDHI